MSTTHRSGALRTSFRAFAPLLDESLRGALSRLSGAAPSPMRAQSPSFGSATWVLGQSPGAVLRSAPMEAVGTRGPRNRALATRFDYVTSDARDRTISATAALFQSSRRWSGERRPLIALAPSTQGVARHCDPSYSCTVGANLYTRAPADAIVAYEQPVINWFLAAGADVVMTDYPRDPSLGWQMYCDHPSGARALYDAVRAARSLGIDEGAPIGLWGYSQGGGTVGRMAEDSDYAPDIEARAAVIGAPPARLDEVLEHVDGSMLTGVVAYTVASLMATSDEIYREVLGELTPYGLRQLLSNTRTCVAGSVLTTGWESTSRWTHSGKTLATLYTDLPAINQELQSRRLGDGIPDIPVLLHAAPNDDVIPFGMIERLRGQWESAGADLEWRANRFPRFPGRASLNHLVPYLTHFVQDAGWLLSRLDR